MRFRFFRKSHKEETRKRTNVDAIRQVLRVAKTIQKPRYHVLELSIILLAFALVFSLSFFSTAGVYALKEKTDALKMFQEGRYLVLFQNNAEMRPTGGFIGSFAVMSFKDYKIQKIDFNTNIFKLDNAFTVKRQITPPPQLAQISQGRWALRDSNFDIDFPTAVEDIQWFYEQESGDSVDGVIAVNASLIQELLKLSGPVYLEKYQTTITADNFFEEMAKKIEKEYFYHLDNQVENEPKTILKDLMPVLMEKSFALPKQKLLQLALRAMNEKMILLQSNNEVYEKAILAANWGGQIKESKSDYLAVNNANITDLALQKNGGAKTSLKIKEAINYQVDEQDGELVGNLTLTRSHTGSYAWPDGVNVNWTRILVPKGAELIGVELNGQDKAKEILIGEEFGKAVFGIWINTAPQTSNVLKISYKLPIAKDNYVLLVQKQPGNLGDELTTGFMGRILHKGVLREDLTIVNK